MKNFKSIFFIFLYLTNINLLSQQLPGKPPSSINQSSTNPFQQPGPSRREESVQKVLPKKERLTTSITTPHSIAGIVGQANGEWVSSDHLYNLKPNMSVYVEVIYPEGKNFQVNEEALTAQVENILRAGGISMPALHALDEPSLPLFNVVVTVNAIEQTMFANVECRLFESVELKRVILDPGITFQAITWQKEELIGALQPDFNATLNQSVQELTKDFVERFNHFLNMRSRLGG